MLRTLREKARKGPPVTPLWARVAWCEEIILDNAILLGAIGEAQSEVRHGELRIANLQSLVMRLEGENLHLLRQNNRYDGHIKRLGSKISALQGGKKR